MALHTDGFAEAVAAAIDRYGADRIAVVLGTSTSGVLSGEDAYRGRDPASGALPEAFDHEHTHDMFSSARYLHEALGLRGPALVVSSAAEPACVTVNSNTTSSPPEFATRRSPAEWTRSAA